MTAKRVGEIHRVGETKIVIDHRGGGLRISARSERQMIQIDTRVGDGIARNEATGEERRITACFVRDVAALDAPQWFEKQEDVFGYLIARDERDWANEASTSLLLVLDDGRRFRVKDLNAGGGFRGVEVVS